MSVWHCIVPTTSTYSPDEKKGKKEKTVSFLATLLFFVHFVGVFRSSISCRFFSFLFPSAQQMKTKKKSFIFWRQQTKHFTKYFPFFGSFFSNSAYEWIRFNSPSLIFFRIFFLRFSFCFACLRFCYVYHSCWNVRAVHRTSYISYLRFSSFFWPSLSWWLKLRAERKIEVPSRNIELDSWIQDQEIEPGNNGVEGKNYQQK